MENPFREEIAEAWREQIDLPSINAAAAADLIRRIERLSSEGRVHEPPPRSQCVLLLGPAGSGKTHLFARLRKKLGRRAVFFYTRPELSAHATPRYLLAQLVDSLRNPVPGSERTQIDLMAASLLSAVAGHPPQFPLTFLEQGIDDPDALIQTALDAAERRYPQILPQYLERLLGVPFIERGQVRRATYTWLSGRAPSEAELKLLGEQEGLGEGDVLPALRTLGFAATFGAPLVIVLDQLENLADDDPEHARAVAHAQLVAELHDTVPGTLILQMAVDSEWTRFIRPALPLPLRQRVEREVGELTLPTPEQARELVGVYLDKLPPDERGGPFPWPLDPADVERWAGQGMTPRALIMRCRRAFDDFLAGKKPGATAEPEPGAAALAGRLARLYEEIARSAQAEVQRAAEDGHHIDAERVASGLLAVLRLRGAPARRAAGKRQRPDVHISSEPPCTVLIAQQNHHRSLSALLADALKIQGARVAVVRERDFDIPETWKQVQIQLADLRKKPGSLLAGLSPEELVLWLATERMLGASRSQDLADDQGHPIPQDVVVDWLGRHLRESRSPVLDGLLLAPGTATTAPQTATAQSASHLAPAVQQPPAPATPQQASTPATPQQAPAQQAPAPAQQAPAPAQQAPAPAQQAPAPARAAAQRAATPAGPETAPGASRRAPTSTPSAATATTVLAQQLSLPIQEAAPTAPATDPREAAAPRTPKPPAAGPRRRAPDSAAETREAEEVEKLVLGQLRNLGVSVTVTQRIVGARLVRLEVSSPRQRVADLDRAAADVEHKLVERGARFEREGARRFFSAPRTEPRDVSLDDLLRREEAWLRERPGRFIVGERIDGEVVKGDLSDGGCCHLLIAGQTGSGKSVLLRALIVGMARFHPASRVRFTLGDPKRVTFGPLADRLAGHIIEPISHDAEGIVVRLEQLVEEMNNRYSMLQRHRLDDIHRYNAVAVQKVPVEVIVIDEFADLMHDRTYKQPFLAAVKRIGGMGRAAGIHLLLATQRPDKAAVPGEIKANLVGKIALKVQSAVDSRIVLDEGGAEKLLGRGDLLANLGQGPVRAQAPALE